MSWGYACCHSFLHNSYCVGEAGKAGTSTTRTLGDTAPAAPVAPSNGGASDRTKTLVEQHQDRLRQVEQRDAGQSTSGRSGGKGKGRRDSRSRSHSESPARQAKRLDDGEAPELDRERLRRAMEKEKKRKEMDDDAAWQATKRGKADVTQEEVEAYRMSKQAYDDPMANYRDEE